MQEGFKVDKEDFVTTYTYQSENWSDKHPAYFHVWANSEAKHHFYVVIITGGT